MGAKANIAAITALNTADYPDNIVFAASGELKFLLLQKTSTATVNNTTVWAATPSGRWCLTGGSGVATSSIDVLADLAALKALTSASQDKLYILNSTPPIIYNWDAQSTATADDDLIVKLTSVATGRMYKIYPGGGGSTTIVSSTPPSTVLPEGTIYVWTEDSSGSYSPDADGRYPDSVISYVSNGSIWVVVSANMIIYYNNPVDVGKAPNSVQEIWLDTSVSPSVRYGATIDSSGNLSWETI